MRHSSRLVMFLFALCALTFPVQAAEQIVLTIHEGIPPYAYREGNKSLGLYPRLMKAIFSRMPQYHLELVPLPWKRAVLQVERGENIGVIPPYYRPIDRSWMRYSDPVYEERMGLFCTESVAAKMKGKQFPQDYVGLIFGNNAGGLGGGAEFLKMGKEHKFSIEEAPTTEHNLHKMILGRIDCYTNDEFATEWTWSNLVKKENGMKRNFVLVQILSVEKSYLGLTSTDKFPFRDAFLKSFNEALAQTKASGEFDLIVSEVRKGQMQAKN